MRVLVEYRQDMELGTWEELSVEQPRLEEVLWTQVSRLHPAARLLLELLAVAGHPLGRGPGLRGGGHSPAGPRAVECAAAEEPHPYDACGRRRDRDLP